MKNKTTDFLFGCKNLYHLSIHPFDFEKSDLTEYVQLIKLGKEIMKEIGIQNFAGFVVEYQYRVDIWSSMITLDFGMVDPNEILKISGTKTIFETCLEKIEQKEINELPIGIYENKKSWIKKIKACYNDTLK